MATSRQHFRLPRGALLYHGSPRADVNSILEDGIRPRKPTGYLGRYHRYPRTWPPGLRTENPALNYAIDPETLYAQPRGIYVARTLDQACVWAGEKRGCVWEILAGGLTASMDPAFGDCLRLVGRVRRERLIGLYSVDEGTWIASRRKAT